MTLKPALLGVCALCATLPLVAASSATKANKDTQAHPAIHRQWAAQTISGSIELVDPAQKLLVVQTASGVPFDIRIDAQTKIRAGGHVLDMQGLSSDVNKNVSVSFTPERRGDFAKSVQITG